MESPDDIKKYFEAEKRLASLFVTFLQGEKGFPSDSIGRGIILTKGLRPDVTIIEPKSKQIIAIIEIKGAREAFENYKVLWKQQLVSYLSAAGNPYIQTYLIMPAEENGGKFSFQICRSDEKSIFVPVAPDEFPHYSTLSTAVISGSINNAEKKQQKAVDVFLNYSYLLAIFLLILVSFAILDWWKPTWEKLSLIGGAVVLMILPHLKRLKVFGLEIERLGKSD
jgi:hypothetical protein